MRAALCLITLTLAGCHPATFTPHDAGTGPGTWTELRPLDQERFEAAAASIHGKVYYFGGISDVCPSASPCMVDRVDAYDPANDSWSPAPPLPPLAPRHHLALAGLNDVVYVLGGFVGIIGTPQPVQP